MDTRSWLLATAALTACLWIPYVLERFYRIGIWRSLENPDPHVEFAPWAVRAKAAHWNAIENFAVFAPLAVLAIHLNLSSNPIVLGASATYFFARLGHFVLFSLGVPVLRTLAFLVGFGAQLALIFAMAGAA